MPDVHVDHTGGSEDVPEDVFEDGPPGEDDAGGVRFTDRTQAEKLASWRAYFDNGGTLAEVLNAAQQTAAAANAGGGIQQPNYDRIVTINYDGANGMEMRLLSGPIFDEGPRDANDVLIDPDFDTNNPTMADKKSAWCNHWQSGGDYAPFPEAPINHLNAQDDHYIQAIEPFETDPTNARSVMCCGALGWAEKNPKKSVAIVLSILASGVLAALFGTGVLPPKSKNAGGLKKPGKPVNLKITSTATVISATWEAPSDGGAVASYTADLIDGLTMDVIESQTVNITGALQVTFTTKVTPGNYLVRITAINTTGSEVTTDAVQVMKPTTGGGPGLEKPGQPVDAKAGYYESKVNIYWKAPITGGAVESYSVELLDSSGKVVFGPLNAGTRRVALFEEVPPGTYSARITAINLTGKASESIPVKPTEIDWTMVLTPAEITKWKSRMDQITGMDEDDFWTQVFAAINDPLQTGNPGQQPASYQDQEVLANFLTMVIQQPELPPDSQVAVIGNPYRWAVKIAQTAQPKFPNKPPATPYADPIAVWTAASKLQNELDTADQPLRYKLFGMERALERYLGIAPVQQGNNS